MAVIVFLKGQNGLRKTNPYCHQRQLGFFLRYYIFSNKDIWFFSFISR